MHELGSCSVTGGSKRGSTFHALTQLTSLVDILVYYKLQRVYVVYYECGGEGNRRGTRERLFALRLASTLTKMTAAARIIEAEVHSFIYNANTSYYMADAEWSVRPYKRTHPRHGFNASSPRAESHGC